MFRRSLTAAAITCAATAMAVLGSSGAASAADVDLNVYDGGTAVGFIRHIDNGDKFRVYDTDSDGHGVRGWLYDANLKQLKTVYNGGGTGTYKQFGYNILEGKKYYMKICTVDGAGDTTPIDCAQRELYE